MSTPEPRSLEDELTQLRKDVNTLNDDILYLHEYITEFYLSVDSQLREIVNCCHECKSTLHKEPH